MIKKLSLFLQNILLKSLELEVKIWSNDKELKKALEGRIEVLSTKEILERLRIKL